MLTKNNINDEFGTLSEMESKNDGFIINEMNNWRKYKTINPKRCEIDNVGNNILIFIIEKGLLSLRK